MKPQNETEIKVIDFGSSCYEHQRGTFDLKLFSYLLIYLLFLPHDATRCGMVRNF